MIGPPVKLSLLVFAQIHPGRRRSLLPAPRCPGHAISCSSGSASSRLCCSNQSIPPWTLQPQSHRSAAEHRSISWVSSTIRVPGLATPLLRHGTWESPIPSTSPNSERTKSRLTDSPETPLRRVTFELILLTAAGIVIEGAIVDATAARVYLQIASKAKQLRELGMSDRAIGRAPGVDDRTVAKATASLGA